MKLQQILIFLILFVCCKKAELKENLIQPNSVWQFTTKDLLNSGREKSAILIFNHDGTVSEKNTILNYNWFYVASTDVLVINNQSFRILKADKNRIILRNMQSGIMSELNKIR